jgi:hypothetical protein
VCAYGAPPSRGDKDKDKVRPLCARAATCIAPRPRLTRANTGCRHCAQASKPLAEPSAKRKAAAAVAEGALCATARVATPRARAAAARAQRARRLPALPASAHARLDN